MRKSKDLYAYIYEVKEKLPEKFLGGNLCREEGNQGQAYRYEKVR